MSDRAYRRSRFSEAIPYLSTTVAFPWEESDDSWFLAPQAYDVANQFDGQQEAIEALVEGAQWILELGEDWDGEGAPGYEQETLQRATELLGKIASCCWDFWGCAVSLPEINPADGGSLDLAWRGPVRLLINVPRGDEVPPTFAALSPDVELYGSVMPKVLPTLVDLLRHGG